MTAIEQKEIRGINLKAIYWIVSSCAVVIITVMTSYFNIIGKLDRMQVQGEEKVKYDDLRIRTIDLKVQALEIEMKDLRKMITEKNLITKN